jgi:ABC-type lipoprotein export system ATPase subunit
MPVVSATQRIEVRGSLSEPLSAKKTKSKRIVDVAQVVQQLQLLNKCKVLCSIPSTIKKKKKTNKNSQNK